MAVPIDVALALKGEALKVLEELGELAVAAPAFWGALTTWTGAVGLAGSRGALAVPSVLVPAPEEGIFDAAAG
jgi:hypothetical protein